MSFESLIFDQEEGVQVGHDFFNPHSVNIGDSIKELIKERRELDKLNKDNNLRSTIYLYGILDRIYKMGCVIVNDDHPDQDVKGKFDAYCKSQSIKPHKDTNYFVRLCAVVFGREKGSRYSAYGNALLAAFDEGVAMDGLIEFLTKQGGIEEVRRRFSKSGNSKGRTIKSKADDALSFVTRMRVASITEPSVCELVEKGPKNGMAVLLVTLEDDETLTVHAVSQIESIVDRVVIQAEKDSRNPNANSEEVDED